MEPIQQGVLCGIDEAGLGPTLGPLVIGAIALRVPAPALDTCLWKALHRSVAPNAQRAGTRLAITDSKKLFGQRRSLAALERPVLATLAAWGHRVHSWRDLLSLLAPTAAAQIEAVPWYASDFALPLDRDTGDVATRATPLRRDMQALGIALQSVRLVVMDAGELNRQVDKARNKSQVELDAVLRLMDRVFQGAADEPVRLVCDRLGGRTRYRDALMRAFPEYALRIEEESDTCSRYTLRDGRRVRRVEFHVQGEFVALTTALAGMFCKYVRECFMHAFNRYWVEQIPGLTPTAGYYTDAQRFLRQTESVRTRLAVPDRILIRSR